MAFLFVCTANFWVRNPRLGRLAKVILRAKLFILAGKYITVDVVGGSSIEHIEHSPHPGSKYDLKAFRRYKIGASCSSDVCKI